MTPPKDTDFPNPSRPLFGVSPGFVFTTSFMWLMAAVATWWLTGKMERIFAEFGAKMPLLTQYWLQCHKVLSVACGLVVVGLVVKEFLPIPWRTRATLNIGAFAVWLLWLAAMGMALGLPFIAIMQSLMGGGGGGGAGTP